MDEIVLYHNGRKYTIASSDLKLIAMFAETQAAEWAENTKAITIDLLDDPNMRRKVKDRKKTIANYRRIRTVAMKLGLWLEGKI